MKYDKDKVDEMVLTLLYLVMFKDSYEWQTWKSFDWDALDRLHEKGYISDPKSKNKSVAMEESGVRLAKQLFKQHFGMVDS